MVKPFFNDRKLLTCSYLFGGLAWFFTIQIYVLCGLINRPFAYRPRMVLHQYLAMNHIKFKGLLTWFPY